MGADISYPEGNETQLTSEAVVGIIGESYFDQVKWAELAGESDIVTVQQLREAVNQYAKDQINAMGKEDVVATDVVDNENATNTNEEEYDDLNQESTVELVSIARSDDDKTNMDESTLLPESTRDVDDFTMPSSFTVNRVVNKLPEEEFAEKHRNLKILYQKIRESRVAGVISKKMKDYIPELRELMTIYYDQTNEFFIMKSKKEKMLIFIAEYYYLIDHSPKGRDFMRFYAEGSQFKIAGLHNFEYITDSKPIAIALLKMYKGIKVCHEVLDIAIEEKEEEDCFWDLFVTVSCLVKLDKDEPRKVTEFFHLKERMEDEFRAMYGQYYIKKQIIVDQGFRPFWCHSELSNIPDQDYRNYDEALGKPEWLLDKEEKERVELEERLAFEKAERKRLRKLRKKREIDSDEESSTDEEEEEEVDEDGNVVTIKKKKIKDPEFVELEPQDDDQSKSSLLSSKIIKKLPRDDSVIEGGEEEWGYEEGAGGGENQQQNEDQEQENNATEEVQ